MAPTLFRPDGQPLFTVTRNHLWRLHDRLRARLPMWVIYDTTTREYPGRWVARMHVCLPEARSTRFVMTHDDLESLRGILPPGLARLARDPSDPPEIYEMWL